MFISNTAFTDNLLAAAGLMSAASAGDLDKGWLLGVTLMSRTFNDS